VELETQATELEEQREQALHLAGELREANARLEELNASLERALTDARTAQQAAVEARQTAEVAQHVAEAANAAKRDFLAVMSHELRTPLNAIGGHAQLLELGLHGPVTPEQLAALGRIQRAERHLLGLINGVLNYAKLEAGHVRYEAGDVPAAEALADAAALVAPQARAKGLSLEVGRCAPAPTGRP
jgi:signal transduction histidine kinase